jgi:aminoglycoside phosphotransferase
MTSEISNLVASLRERTQSSEFEQVRDGESSAVVFAVRSAGGALTEFVKIDSASATEPIRDEYEVLRYLQQVGIAAPAPIELGTWSGLEWMRTMAINGIAFEDMQPDRAIVALAGILRRLHSLPTDGCPFQRRTRSLLTAAQHTWDSGLVDTDDFDDQRRGIDPQQLLAYLVTNLPEEELAVVHGDITETNVVFSPGPDDDAILLDAGRLGVGDRWRDLALAERTIRSLWGQEHVEEFFDVYGAAIDMARIEYFQVLDEFF